MIDFLQTLNLQGDVYVRYSRDLFSQLSTALRDPRC